MKNKIDKKTANATKRNVEKLYKSLQNQFNTEDGLKKILPESANARFTLKVCLEMGLIIYNKPNLIWNKQKTGPNAMLIKSIIDDYQKRVPVTTVIPNWLSIHNILENNIQEEKENKKEEYQQINNKSKEEYLKEIIKFIESYGYSVKKQKKFIFKIGFFDSKY